MKRARNPTASSTFPIEWHQECLRNMDASLKHARDELDRQRFKVDRLQYDVNLRKRQIAEAERRGLTEFDHNRLLIRRVRAADGTGQIVYRDAAKIADESWSWADENNLNLRIREALGVTNPWSEEHARHNLDGALIDIEHANGQADEICRRTIRRVIGQLAEVERILECADDPR